jgi:zinc D-Ala-D-Ala carboxypeptidase
MPNWRRSERIQLTKNFSSAEFVCKCGLCSQNLINDQFLAMLQEVRDLFGKPITITSAFRCAHHQETLRRNGIETAVGKSSHETGCAADLSALDMQGLRAAVEQVFAKHSIGYANKFVHVDSRPNGPRRWNYK